MHPQPSLRGHLVGTVVGGACQIFHGGFRGYKTNVFYFLSFCGPLSGLLVGFPWPLGNPFRSVSVGSLDALHLEISTVLWVSQAPLEPLRQTTGQSNKETLVQSGLTLEHCQNNNSP